MKTFERYIDSKDCVWYDSSNIIYSECKDNQSDTKPLKIVFKQGRTYLYSDVSVEDYIMFRNADSNGKAFNQYIKKYECVRLPDTNLTELEDTKKKYMEEVGAVEKEHSNIKYLVEMNSENGAIKLYMNGNLIFEGVEDKVNMMRLLNCMSINYQFREMEETTDGQEQSESGDKETD
jgi:hypothetical protein